MKFNCIKYAVVAFLAIMISCKQDNSSEVMSTGDTMISTVTGEEIPLDPLPVACELISAKQMAEFLGKEESAFEILDGNRNQPGANNTACFYKWKDPVYDASGVFIQIQRNSLPDELPDFVMATMNNKKWEGENSMDEPGKSFKYVDYSGLEVPAIYCAEIDRYYFTKGYKYLYSVAFNYPIKEEEMNAIFNKIANLMLKKF
jgi:hypothetical protein